jgi:hypothetical protein
MVYVRLYWCLLVFLVVWLFYPSWVVASLAAAYTLGHYAGSTDQADYSNRQWWRGSYRGERLC